MFLDHLKFSLSSITAVIYSKIKFSIKFINVTGKENIMKILISFLFIFLTCLQPAYSQWNPQTSGTNQYLTSVFFVNSSTGFCAGGQTTLLKTTNSGSNWQAINANLFSGEEYSAIFFVNASTGWFSTGSGNTAKTTNGGANWVSQMPMVGYATLSGIFFINENTGWMAGSGGSITRTTNGGAQWTPQSSGTTTGLRSIFFLDANKGFAAGNTDTIFYTTNGGSVWSKMYSNSAYSFLRKIYFVNANTGFIASTGGKVVKTNDGGASWSAVNTGIYDSFDGLHFYNENTGFVCGDNGLIMATTNGGNNWFNQPSGVTSSLNSIHFSGANGWAVGQNGTILFTNNGGGALGIINYSSQIPNEFALTQNYPNPFNPYTRFKVNVAFNSYVIVAVYDVLGRLVETLVNSELKPGIYEVEFDAADYPSGIYFYTMNSGNLNMTKKMILVK